MTSEVDSYPKIPDLTCMIIYSVFLISWIAAQHINFFFYYGHNPMQTLQINPDFGFVVIYLYPFHSSLSSQIFLLQGSEWMTFSKFILEVLILFTRCDPLTWPINHTCSDPGQSEFSFRVTKVQSAQ